MLFHHNGTLLVANWAQTSAGSVVLLSSISADGDWSSRGGGGGSGWEVGSWQRRPRIASSFWFSCQLFKFF